ncbi:M20/M25/M40 family metallo-hydrolase [Corynebacterium sp. TA-R-1]|uniref:M20/M25/M40 family metallo-hydrolase n=1 Tax=Corynebacterium stercoris TaxID=2943490 RepID=A0ABT1G3H1_9CORY|nr:M20/M25/M40 family metallo-hydrolase [Corynebacterium stercoris]MCP1388220.1 M20/M25/M40 family metallo-hydrolase [Corynebacterium stercoris]
MTAPNLNPNRDRIWEDMKELVSFYSPHSTPAAEESHQAAADFCAKALEELGLNVERFETIDNADLIIGTKEAQNGAPTVVLYSHYDTVIVTNPDAWTNPPTELTERDGRWYGRGAADCKGNIAMHLESLRLVEEAGGTDLGLKVVFEGAEELGGKDSLSKMIKERPELFDADMIVIGDGGNVEVGHPTLVTTLRGGGQVHVKVDTLEGAIHSGGYGGAAPDAAHALVRIIDSLFDEHGRTRIDGVECTGKWDGDPYGREAFRKDARILDGVEILGTEDEDPADMIWARPALTVIGFTSVPVVDASNIVNPTAECLFNLRVPAGQDAAEVAEKVKEHVINHAPYGAKIEVEISGVNQPFDTDVHGEGVATVIQALKDAYGSEEMALIGSGGSIPLCVTLQQTFPDAEFALYGVEEPKCNIHGVDESVDPTEIEHVAKAQALFLLRYGK